ncbi:sugar porter family MFS transporter [Halioxenophilus aromaticivorans]|uniref:Myo-inositol transporter IolT n=1 Tax=Halioxenophilus aromaticivorans TaxID=1306992 RepID=A0AAV3TVY4_9ALTE
MSQSAAVSPSIDLPENKSGPHTSRLGLITVVATFGGLLFGYDTGVINGALEPMKLDLGLNPAKEGFVVSILIFGAALGALIGGNLADRYGRKHNIMLLALVFMVGTLGCCLAPNWQMLGLFRFILGLAVGGASTTVPIYLAEVSPFEKRGSLVTRNEVMIVSGQFAAFIINAILFSVWGEHEVIWRYMLAVAVLPAIALFVGMMSMPESPRWLASKGRKQEAFEVLSQIRSPERAAAEMEEINALSTNGDSRPTSSWKDLTTPWIRRLIIIGIGVGVFQQLTGINSIMYYGTQLLQQAGFTSQGAIVANTLFGLASVVGICIGLMVMNKLDRRVMLLGGFVLTTLFHLLVGLSAYFLPESAAKPYVVLSLVIAFVFFMQGTIGPLAWLLLSEIFPLHVRSYAMGVCVFMLWITNATVAFVFPPIVSQFGIAPTFFLFAALGVLALIFIGTMVPETRGKTLEEFEDEFKAEYS